MLLAGLLPVLASGCDRSREGKRAFYESLKIEYRLAVGRLEKEQAAAPADDFRKRMDAGLKKLEKPGAVWSEYGRAIVPMRFQEAVERVCGRDSEERNTDLMDISLAAVSVGYGAQDPCKRLYLFSALYKSVMGSMLGSLPGSFDLDPRIKERIGGAAEDPDCLVRAGYLFMMGEDEKKTLLQARKLLGSPGTMACGLDFVDFLDPGNIDVVLPGVKTAMELDADKGDKAKILREIVRHLAPLLRQDGEAVVKNLEVITRSQAVSGRLALVLLSFIDEPWHGKFWEETALYGQDPEERFLALQVLAGRKDEGLPCLRNILAAGEKQETERLLGESFVSELSNVLIRSWKKFSREAVKKENLLPLLEKQLGRYPPLGGKMAHLRRILTWQGGKASEQEAAEAFLDAIGAVEPELKICWLRARMKDPMLQGGVMNVSARMAEEGQINDVSAEDTDIPSELLKECVRDTFKMLSFNDGFFDEDQIVGTRIAFPIGMTQAGAPGTAGPGVSRAEAAPPPEAEPAGKIIPRKPSIGKIVVGGGKDPGLAEVKKKLAPQMGYFALCAGAAMEHSPEFKPGLFTLVFDVVGEGRLVGIKIEGSQESESFLKCLKRGLGKVRMTPPSSGKVWVKVQISFPE